MKHGFKQTAEWANGRWGEVHVREYFQSIGWWAVPLGLIEDGGAPALTSALERIVLPDLQVARNGQLRLVEVKTKHHAPWYGKLQRHQHGMSLRCWRDYRKACREMDTEGYLAVVEQHQSQECPPRYPAACGCRAVLLLGSFDEIATNAQEDESEGTIRAFKEPMVFFDRRHFEKLALTASGPQLLSKHVMPALPAVRQTYVVRPWEKNRSVPDIEQRYLL